VVVVSLATEPTNMLLVIGKCNAYQVTLDEVGGNKFFKYFATIPGRVCNKKEYHMNHIVQKIDS
jgi:hypothetical protein